jgi:hypothetical protein
MRVEQYFGKFHKSPSLEFISPSKQSFTGLELASVMSLCKLSIVQTALCFAKYVDCNVSKVQLRKILELEFEKRVSRIYDRKVAKMLTEEVLSPRSCKSCSGTGRSQNIELLPSHHCAACDGSGIRRFGSGVMKQYGIPKNTFCRHYQKDYDDVFAMLEYLESQALDKIKSAKI